MTVATSDGSREIENGHPPMRRMLAQADMEGKSLGAVCNRGSLGRDLFLTSLGNFAIFAAIRRASSLLSNLAADRRPGSSSK